MKDFHEFCSAIRTISLADFSTADALEFLAKQDPSFVERIASDMRGVAIRIGWFRTCVRIVNKYPPLDKNQVDFVQTGSTDTP